MAVKLSPIYTGEQFFTAAGQPLSGGKINTYLAGTTTAQATFTDATGVTPNANPIILDSTGRYSAQIWLTAGVNYKFVLTDSNNNTLATEDNLSGINDTTSGVTSEWLPQSTPTFVSGTSFTITGNQTSTFQVGMRVKATINAGFIYGTIQTSVFTSLTTVTVTNDSGALDNTLSAVSVGLLGETNPSVPASIPYKMTFGNAVITTATVGTLVGIAADGAAVIQGTNTNDNATTGNVGEFVTANSSGISLTNNTATAAASATLAAGDWDVWGIVAFNMAATTTWTVMAAGIATANGSLTAGQYAQILQPSGANPAGGFLYLLPSPVVRVPLSTATIVYLNAMSNFAVSTNTTGQSFIYARRRR